MSKMASGTEFSAAYSRKLLGSLNVTTPNPADSNNRPTDLRTNGSSSTTQIASRVAVLEPNSIQRDGSKIVSSRQSIPYSSGQSVSIPRARELAVAVLSKLS